LLKCNEKKYEIKIYNNLIFWIFNLENITFIITKIYIYLKFYDKIKRFKVNQLVANTINITINVIEIANEIIPQQIAIIFIFFSRFLFLSYSYFFCSVNN